MKTSQKKKRTSGSQDPDVRIVYLRAVLIFGRGHMKSLFEKSDVVGAVGKSGADRCLQNAFPLLEQNARIRQLLCLKIEPWRGFEMRPEHTVQRT